MLATLAASPTWEVAASTEHDLYKHFVDEFLKRELKEKDARAYIPERARLEFMMRIAWWLWVERKTISFSVDQVPPEIIQPVRKFFDDGEHDGVILREMLVGSVLERRRGAELVTQKDDYAFYFPHRSYWEFLVSEYIASEIFSIRDLRFLMSGFGVQIEKFLSERSDRQFVGRLLYLISEHRDALDAAFVKSMATIIKWRAEDEGRRMLLSKNVANLRYVALAAAAGLVPFPEYKMQLENMREIQSIGSLAAVIMLGNMFLWLCDRSSRKGLPTSYVRNLNCRFLRTCFDIVGISNLIDEGRLGTNMAATASVSREVSGFWNTVKVAQVDGEAWLRFDAREIVFALNKCRTRIERLTFRQDLTPNTPRPVIQVKVVDFVDSWINPRDRSRCKSLLQYPLPQLVH
jgi:hypothetical protein